MAKYRVELSEPAENDLRDIVRYISAQLSGIITLSTEEWVKSRSCQRATFSSAATALPLTTLDNPATLSLIMGFLLWGIAEEPFCPFRKGSSTSRISVRCRFLISVAIFSRELAIMARTVINWAWRSL
jgi:hypothetical protein